MVELALIVLAVVIVVVVVEEAAVLLLLLELVVIDAKLNAPIRLRPINAFKSTFDRFNEALELSLPGVISPPLTKLFLPVRACNLSKPFLFDESDNSFNSLGEILFKCVNKIQ